MAFTGFNMSAPAASPLTFNVGGGTTASPGTLFGTTAAPTWGAATQPAAAAAAGGFLGGFGATSGAAIGGSPIGGLGARLQPAAPLPGALGGGGLPGAAFPGFPGASSASSLFPQTNPLGGFGQSAGMFQSSGALWKSQPVPQQAFPGPGVPGPQAVAPYSEKEMALQELKDIEAAYNAAPENIKYRFRALFNNLVSDPSQKVKPAGVDEVRFREALVELGGINNPDSLWPVLANGFAELQARMKMQDSTLSEYQLYVSQIRDLTREVRRTHETVNEERVARVREQHEVLQGRLLRLWRRLSALEARSARAHSLPVPVPSPQLSPRLHKLRENLQQWHSALPSRAQALAAALRLRDGSLGQDSPLYSGAVTNESIVSLQQVLSQQTDALHRLSEVMKRDQRDLAIIEKAKQNQERT